VLNGPRCLCRMPDNTQKAPLGTHVTAQVPDRPFPTLTPAWLECEQLCVSSRSASTTWVTMSQSHACCKGAHLCFRIRPGHPCALACVLTSRALAWSLKGISVQRVEHGGRHAVAARTAPCLDRRARAPRTRTIRGTTSWMFSSVPSRGECRRCPPTAPRCAACMPLMSVRLDRIQESIAIRSLRRPARL